MALRVFHADDSSQYRFLVRETLADEDVEVVGEAGYVDELLDGVRATQPDVVLLDRLGGPEVIDAVRAAAPAARIIVLTGRKPEDGGADFIGRADAYVLKGAELDELRRVVRG